MIENDFELTNSVCASDKDSTPSDKYVSLYRRKIYDDENEVYTQDLGVKDS